MVFDRSSINVGRTIQDFGLGDLSGNYRNTAKLRVKGWLIIVFFDAANSSSAATTDILKAWTTSLPSDKVAMLGVGIGQRSDVEAFEKDHDPGFPLVWDYDEYVSATWSVSALPTVYVTNAGGKVLARVVGESAIDLESARSIVAAEIAKADEAARIAAEKAAAEKAAADAAAAVPAKA
jgi:peroxiredoxin